MNILEQIDRLADSAIKVDREMLNLRMFRHPIRVEVYKVSQAAQLLSAILYALYLGSTDVEQELSMVQKQIDSLSKRC
jgi:hypothetical protein